jgi:large subunit ribosomal protein L9
VLASAGVARVAEVQRQIENRKQEQTEAELVELGQQLDGREIILNARVGAKDKLFGSITVADITAELKNIGLVVDKRKVELIEPIRRLGSHEITIKLTKDIIPKIKVIVTGEETD